MAPVSHPGGELALISRMGPEERRPRGLSGILRKQEGTDGNWLGLGMGKLQGIEVLVCYGGGQITKFQGSFHMARFYHSRFPAPSY